MCSWWQPFCHHVRGALLEHLGNLSSKKMRTVPSARHSQAGEDPKHIHGVSSEIRKNSTYHNFWCAEPCVRCLAPFKVFSPEESGLWMRKPKLVRRAMVLINLNNVTETKHALISLHAKLKALSSVYLSGLSTTPQWKALLYPNECNTWNLKESQQQPVQHICLLDIKVNVLLWKH